MPALPDNKHEIDTISCFPGVLSNTRGSAPMSGFAFSSRTMSLKKTIIISLSHSGQTFPTLHATHTLRKLCGDRVFVVTGSVDSKMSAAVGQLSYAGAPWLARTWTTFAGSNHARAKSHTRALSTNTYMYICSIWRHSNFISCTWIFVVCACGHCMYTQDGDLLRL